jgi:spermidine synthase
MDSVRWSIHFRGNTVTTDLQENVLKNRWGNKRMLFSGKSEHQRIDVWQNTLDGNTDTLSRDGHVDPINLYLDGSLQSSTGDEHIYHESLIHPAMVLHATAAQRVAVVGGGDIAASREILRHRSITAVDLVELDAMVSNVTQQHIPQLNNCTFGASTFRSCLDDTRVHVHTANAVEFFTKKCADGGKQYDVVFMDLLDPEQHPKLGEYLYGQSHFASLKCVLKPDGIFVAQVGDAPSSHALYRLRLGPKVELIKNAAALFHATFVYDVFVPSFRGEWSFLIGCLTNACSDRWQHMSADVVDTVMQQRLLPQASNLSFFDGAVMSNFQAPSMPWHTLM